jgi:hypothetical protein
VVGNLFGEGAAPSQQVEGWRQNLYGIYLGDYILKFKMSATKGLPFGGVSLRKD